MRDGPGLLPHEPRAVQVTLPNGPLRLWTPAGAEAILDKLAEAPPDPDDKMPYWADLWPSAVALAEAIEVGQIEVRDRTVLELGAGLGVPSLAAARNGGRVRATDWDEDAIRYVRASAVENELNLLTERLDWREPEATSPAAVLLLADVLYEPRNVEPVLKAIRVLLKDGGEAWLADPGRAHLPTFVAAATDFRFAHLERTVHGLTPAPAQIQILKMLRP